MAPPCCTLTAPCRRPMYPHSPTRKAVQIQPRHITRGHASAPCFVDAHTRPKRDRVIYPATRVPRGPCRGRFFPFFVAPQHRLCPCFSCSFWVRGGCTGAAAFRSRLAGRHMRPRRGWPLMAPCVSPRCTSLPPTPYLRAIGRATRRLVRLTGHFLRSPRACVSCP